MVMYYANSRKVLASLLNWFTFDNRADSTVNDYSEAYSTVHQATLVSGASCSGTGVDGILSGALLLSGGAAGNTTDHATLTAAETDMLSDKGTVCAWINVMNVGVRQVIYEYSMWNAVGAANYYITIALDVNDLLSYTFKNFASAPGLDFFQISGTTAVATGWTHVAVTSDGNTTKLYINGNEENGADLFGTNAGQWFGDLATSGTWTRQIGVSIHSGAFSDHFSGAIDNFRLASYPMTQEQIRQLYESNM